MKALEGLKVLHLYRTQPSSFAAMFFSDFGADVTVLVEPGWIDRLGDVASWLETTIGLDRNKRSAAINLKSPEGKEIFLRMARDADLVIDGLRPGATAKLGIDYEHLAAINPRIVYVAISGYGRESPLRRQVGHDINYLSLAGLLPSLANLDPAKKFLPLVPIADAAAGIYGALGGFIALLARERTGEGQLVDVAYTDAAMSLAATFLLSELATPGAGDLGAPMTGGAFPLYDVYETKDGKLVSIACIEPWFWENLCRTIGAEEYIDQQLTLDRQDEIRAAFAAKFREKSRAEWDATFLGSGVEVCYGPVHTLEEAVASPYFRERGVVVDVERDGRRYPEIGPAVRLSKTPGAIERADPKLGQDTDAVLAALGYGADRLADLRSRGIIA